MFKRCRRFIAGCSLASFTLLLVGLPVPQPVHKDAAQPFPCQQHACGCSDAAQCWQSCCCFTPQERLAWAERRGLTPPPMAAVPMAAIEHDSLAGHQAPANHGHEGCCSAEHESAPADEAPADGWRLVLTSQVLQCQGGAAIWATIGPALPPPTLFVFSHDVSVVERLAPRNQQAACLALPVDSPPPEQV